MYFIDISQCPHTAETMGYNFFPFRPLNATPKYWPSTMKLKVPSSMSSATMNYKKRRNEISVGKTKSVRLTLSGTRKVSSGLRIAG